MKSLSACTPELIESTLRSYLDKRIAELEVIHPDVATLGGFVRDFTLNGGKRMRPLFAWTGYCTVEDSAETSGAQPEDFEAVIKAVSSLELIQACALIHDDIIDASDSRRGKPTVHRQVESFYSAHPKAERLGNDQGILLGDLALAWADDMFFEAGLSTSALARAWAPWHGMRSEVIAGQILDIHNETTGQSSAVGGADLFGDDLERAVQVMRYKTAAYTVERPLHIGAAIAGASNEIIDALRTYGVAIGKAFQLRDDLLGVFGDPAITGKPAGDDLREGKRTVLLAFAAQELGERAHLIDDYLGKAEYVETLRDIISSTNAEARCEQRIEELREEGLAAVKGLPTEETLVSLALKATARKF
ncbi:MAG: polyprenyl synthetase family protein [Corynebacterium sp.]|nr:polyprenyl synthetase family protein [Corynebacterium sp.]